MAAHLRVFPTVKPIHDEDAQEASIRVCLADLLPLIAEAHHRDYSWLKDFVDDEVLITPDLYEVLRAFHAQRPSA